jgi:isoleucyl-tRNA synthetase
LRASKELATTTEAAVTLTVPDADRAWLESYREELAGFLMVAAIDVVAAAGEPGATVAKTPWRRCDRCWTHRPDVREDGGICGRCEKVLAATGRSAPAGQARSSPRGSSA